MEKILVTGATGYVGGRLIPELLGLGYQVRVMTRDKAGLKGRSWEHEVEVVEGDVLNPETLPPVVAGVDAAYYLIHSMGSHDDFHDADQRGAANFGQAAADAGVERIIYLGGLGAEEDEGLSEHLRSRHDVGETLRESGIPVTEFRAAVIVGSGSISFEMVRYLTERLPIMTTPKWVWTPIQPIGIADVLAYLTGTLQVPESAGEIIEIGGGDVQTYGDMMLIYADERGLKRYLIPVPVLTPSLSSRWVHVVTPISKGIARPLIEGLRNEVVVRDDRAKELFPAIQPMTYRTAVQRALKALRANRVESYWADELWQPDKEGRATLVEKRGMLIEQRQRIINVPQEAAFRSFTGLGGERGWLYLNWLWKLRGWMDRILGGPGYRRGRRDPDDLRVGDMLDFWRVEAIEEPYMLRLRAEMKLPGRGWLEFEAHPTEDGKTRITQTAYYAPHGLLGWLYWVGSYPAHLFIFDGMVDEIADRARSLSATAPA